MTTEMNEKLRENCEVALNTLKKLDDPDTVELQSKLEWCMGSFDHDKNPVGLHEFGVVALRTLKDIKKDQPRRVNKKVLDGLEKCIESFEQNMN